MSPDLTRGVRGRETRAEQAIDKPPSVGYPAIGRLSLRERLSRLARILHKLSRRPMMKRLALILIAAALLAFAPAAHAANLQAGWYVNVGPVGLIEYDEYGSEWGTDWSFTGTPYAVGPYAVTDPGLLWSSRIVSVSPGYVTPGTSVALSGAPVGSVHYCVFRIDVPVETNYDATQMLLNVLVRHTSGSEESLWSQNRSGHLLGTKTIDTLAYSPQSGDALLFRVVAVPEPASLLSLAVPLAILFRRRLPRR